MWKRIVVFAVHAVSIVLIIVLCGFVFAPAAQNQGQTEKFNGVLEKNAILRVLENDTAIEQGYFQQLLDAFNANYAEYGITAVDANMDQYLDLANDGPYGYGPDVLYQANDMLMKYVDGKHIQPLPVQEIEAYSHIDALAWQAYTAEAGGTEYTMGVPVNIQGPLLYYRKDLLPADWETEWDKNSNDVPDMVENWNDLYAFSLERREAGKYGYMKSLFDVYFASGYLFSYGGYIFGDNNTDITDIGFSAGEAEKGARIVKQLASLMNEECIDDTITKNAYSKLASGDYFATMTTPDVYSLFIKEMMNKGMTKAEAEENLVVCNVPALPASGDLTDSSQGFIACKMMGGINGYAMSSYTKYPNAALAFIDFATGYEMIMKRYEILGVIPARKDAADAIGGLSATVNGNLSAGNIVVMPSVRAVAQIWTPAETFFSDLAKDAFRPAKEVKYHNLAEMKAGLKTVDRQIYDAIHTLR